jgi:hypothetical protein
MIEDQTLEEEVARTNKDTEQETVPVSPPSTPMSTAVTADVAREEPAERTIWEQATEIMMMLETTMQRVCAWSEMVEAQTSDMAERKVAIRN